MDVVRGSPAKYRVVDAIPLSGVGRPSALGDFRERPMPVQDATLWTPVSQGGVDPAYPIFITQRALEAVNAQVDVLPKGASSLGFLVGGAYLSPDTRIPYIVVESTIHVPWSISGDHLGSALIQGLAIAHEEMHGSGDRVLGWYHSQFAPQARLSVADVEAHLACFEDPWEVALVVARGVEVTGGLFRVRSDPARSSEYLPFYEIADPDAVVRQGRKSTLAWANYRTQGVALAADLGSQPAGLDQPPLLFPAEADPDADALPVPTRRWALPQPVARAASLGALSIVVAGAAFGAYRVLGSASSRGGAAGGGTASLSAAAVLDRMDRLADTTAFAVAAYGIRARLFDGRKMTCADLARGLVEVEDRWTAYNGARAVAGGEASIDASQVAMDRRLQTDVGAVEDRFARTGCPRP